MENRKAHLMRKAGEEWEIGKFITLRNWTDNKLCQNWNAFFGIDGEIVADMSERVVLDVFEHFVDVNGISEASLNIVVTPQYLFRNVSHPVRDQGDSLILSTDGRYGFIFLGLDTRRLWGTYLLKGLTQATYSDFDCGCTCS